MQRAKDSNQARFWAVQTQYGWHIHDRDHADKVIAHMARSAVSGNVQCSWHDKDYWGTNAREWQLACDAAQFAESDRTA